MTGLEFSRLFSRHYLSRIKELEFAINKALLDESSVIELEQNSSYIRIFTNPIIDSGKNTGAICFFLDISMSKKAEKIGQEFSANVTHELKTPLTSIRGYAELLENGMVKEEDKPRFLAAISRESKRLLELINEILDISELETSTDKQSWQLCYLMEITKLCVKELESLYTEKNIKITLTGTAESVYGDRNQLKQLILNLCNNAVRYNNVNGTVDIVISKVGSNVALTVSDSGIGIPEDDFDRIFERFYRVDKSRSKATGGTGLGLSIVKHIVENHNAKIEVCKNKIAGTCFKVIFRQK